MSDPTKTIPAVRYLVVPAALPPTPELRPAGDEASPVTFGLFFKSLVLPHVPWGDASQQDTLETLARLERAEAGQVVELREGDHAALVRAMTEARRVLPGHLQLELMGFFAAVARARTSPPEG